MWRSELTTVVGVLLTLGLTAHPRLAATDTVLITGANSGIGLEFARQYAAKGWTVIATHRRSETPPTLTDLAAKYNKVRIEKLDVTSVDQVSALATRLKDVPIDVGKVTIADTGRFLRYDGATEPW